MLLKKPYWILLLLCFLASTAGFSQSETPDSISGLKSDTTQLALSNDSTPKPKKKNPFLDGEVDYSAKDSMPFLIEKQKIFLYKGAKIHYLDIDLEADYIEVDLATSSIFATGLPDSSGKIAGKPHFKQGEESFTADTMRYNFKTKKGYIIGVVTEQQGGFLHSEITKRLPDESICIKDGKYTTCNLANPHFYIELTKAKLIPNKKIVSGPAYLVLAGIPTPLALPFGFFPNKRKYTSGVLFPEYGEEQNRGFYLRNGGYYLALSDYFDFAVRGDIYSRGTWGLKLHSNYKLRYRFSGNLDLKYYNNIVGEEGFSGYSKSKDYSIIWSHKQDAKATPGMNFSANVNLSTTEFDKNHSYSANNYLQNTKTSSISFSKSWNGKFNLSLDARHTQNSQTKQVSLTLPSMNFNMTRIYPFRKKVRSGDFKWYENIQMEYRSKFESRVSIGDSLLFSNETFNKMLTGFQHEIPISANFKALKYFNISPRLNYTGKLYPWYIEKRWDYTAQQSDGSFGGIAVDTINQVKYAGTYDPGLSISFNPTVYGMYQMKKGPVLALRHVMTPSVSFSYKPSLGSEDSFLWRQVPVSSDSVSATQTYSIFEGSLYGSPGLKKESGSVNFSLGNNFEMKVKNENDTLTGTSKIKLLESLNFSTRYDLFDDENNWDPISFNGRTTLFKSLNLNFSGSIDPYALDEEGNRTNTSEVKMNHRLGRLTNANLTMGYQFKAKSKAKDKDKKGSDREDIIGDPERDFIDFNIPWSFKVDYSWHYTKPKFESIVTQTLRFSGDISITPKWKISASSGYDFNTKDFSYTTIDIYRDLHCWEARFTWIPFGYHQSYNFQINVKPGVLQDLKWAKRKSWYDNF